MVVDLIVVVVDGVVFVVDGEDIRFAALANMPKRIACQPDIPTANFAALFLGALGLKKQA
jgi:hypothetical protein